MPAEFIFRAHHPYSLAPSENEIAVLAAQGAPGETVSVSFSLASPAGAGELTLSVTGLTGDAGTAPAENLDLYVVKIWEQSGIGVYQGARMMVPELLVKDDRVPLRDGYRRIHTSWKHYIKPRYVHDPPKARLTGDVQTSLAPGRPKQIWLRIRIAADAALGDYSGRIAVGDNTGIPVRLTVLPISLAQPERDLMLWYKGSLDPTHLQYYVDETDFRAQLADIHAHGFTSFSLAEYRAEHLQRALDIAHEVGFRRNVALHWPFPPNVLGLDFHRMRPLLYISDEIDTRGSEHIDMHVANDKIRPSAAETMICLRQQSFMRRLTDPADIGHPPTLVAYFVSDNLPYFLALNKFPQMPADNVYYYWPTHMEKPNLHRVLMGHFLWKSRAAGVFPYCYQHPPVHPNLAYDDFDYWDEGTRGDLRPLRDHMTTYPVRGGSIPTIQWEAMREGIFDLRYLATLQSALDRAAPSEVAREIVERRDAFLARIKFPAIQVMSDTEREPYADIAPEEYGAFRARMQADIMALQEMEE